MHEVMETPAPARLLAKGRVAKLGARARFGHATPREPRTVASWRRPASVRAYLVFFAEFAAEEVALAAAAAFF